MNRIQLYNRDGANLWIEKVEDKDDYSIWKLKVDKKHSYCLEYMRIILDEEDNIEAVDPSGGPFISINDMFENNKYEIIKITNAITFWISEKDNN